MNANQQEESMVPQDQKTNFNFGDPLVLSGGAFMLGLALGSGRFGSISRELAKVAQSLGALALAHFSQSMQKHNPQIFDIRSRMTH